MPKVTVIVPAYNHASFLSRRLESILRQTLCDFELLVLDDASTDNSLEIARRFQSDSRLRLVACETNSGNPFVQWNRGLCMTAGEYVWIAESDDYATPHFLETLVGQLEQNPEAGLACCNSHIVDEKDTILGSTEECLRHLDPNHWNSDFVARGVDECRRFLIFQCTIPNASAVVFRRRSYEKLGGPDETYRLCGDWAFWVKLAMSSDIAFVAEKLNYFRWHKRTVRARAGDAVFLKEMARVRDDIARQIPFSPAELKRLRRDSRNRVMKAWIASIPVLGPLAVKLKRSLVPSLP